MAPTIVDQVGEPSHGNAMQNAKKMSPAHSTADHDCTSDSDDDGQDLSAKNVEEIKVTVAEKGKCIRCGRGCVEVLSDSLQCCGCGSTFHLCCLREGTVDVVLSLNMLDRFFVYRVMVHFLLCCGSGKSFFCQDLGSLTHISEVVTNFG